MRGSLAFALAAVMVAGPAAPVPESRAAVVANRRESLMAACMKEQGFRYIPIDSPRRPPRQNTPEQERQSRARYGFKVFAMYVHTTDQEAGGLAALPFDPNDRLTAALSLTQVRAYSRAYDVCLGSAVWQLTGRQVTGRFDLDRKREKALTQALAREFDSYPPAQLSARKYAACLEDYGYTVRSALPSRISSQLMESFVAERTRLAGAEFPIKEEGVEYLPTLSPSQAGPYLEREIKAALADLTCATRTFRWTHQRQAEVRERVAAEWALD
ncbi:hypothetical protein [Nonomuraea endophytica]|uniref:Uncharacterized protein n=1 Tax=Nonomuraea endophytica TaxID=714136 RepID=A0A7W8EIR9_9ACTN|nr:hypothetical protein [Nonomuraea endophytica]MBB5080816.1 hypothetical protein [Nonomuraea endophytica]